MLQRAVLPFRIPHGPSANRGACAQPCRNLYDLEDASGKTLVRNKALLSLKDYNLLHRLEELADAGVDSFKIEGRLKGESYVRNVVRAYSEALDALVDRYPDRYRRSSFGHVRGSFVPDLDKTFNRGYTELFLDGKRGPWAAEGGGEYIGTVQRLTPDGFVLKPASSGIILSNGDGFTFEGGGFRAEVWEGYTVHCKQPAGLKEGVRLYRNISAAFERQIEAARPVREIDIRLEMTLKDGQLLAFATSEDGRKVQAQLPTPADTARDPERMLQTIREQLGKRSEHYAFQAPSLQVEGPVPFFPTSALNGLRRDLAAKLDLFPVQALPIKRGKKDDNSSFRLEYASNGELMRSKYCIRHELGLCPKQGKAKKAEPLFLRNGKERLRLDFHCAVCEMTVKA